MSKFMRRVIKTSVGYKTKEAVKRDIKWEWTEGATQTELDGLESSEDFHVERGRL
jgi:hypothetical protein